MLSPSKLKTYCTFLIFSLAPLLLLAGCGVSASDPAPTAAGTALTGRVHGGQQAVAGAAVMLYAAGSTGVGTGASNLLVQPVTTDVNGNFGLTGDYTCPVFDGADVYGCARRESGTCVRDQQPGARAGVGFGQLRQSWPEHVHRYRRSDDRGGSVVAFALCRQRSNHRGKPDECDGPAECFRRGWAAGEHSERRGSRSWTSRRCGDRNCQDQHALQTCLHRV